MHRSLTDRLLPFLRRRKYWLAGALLAAWAYWACLPDPLFRDPACTVLEDQAGELLGARIAADGQWRFPHSDSVPEAFAQCLVAFEDKRFWQHPGVDPVALCRAMYHNLRAGRVVSGGSTLTMQVVRLARKGQARSLYEKLVEAVWATRLELGRSKREILALYASNAPFGGNVVGLDAAAWKYYGRPPAQLSWAEAATLAVLPNSPSLIHPGRNRQALRQKRDALLARLAERGVLDSTSAYLAQLEPLPERPLPLPMLAPHLLDRVQASGTHAGAVARTTLRAGLQRQMSQLLQRHHQHLLANGIANGALLVLDVPTGDVLAYVGNVDPRHGAPNAAVDVVPAPRSTGSILKPFLYASMLHQGEALPDMLVPDVPSQFGGYTPKNYDLSYAGALPFREALAKSLNVPFVQLLSRHGVPKLHHFLQAAGIGTLRRGPEHYGLSLILGGAEASLWDLAGTYASMARVLRQYPA